MAAILSGPRYVKTTIWKHMHELPMLWSVPSSIWWVMLRINKLHPHDFPDIVPSNTYTPQSIQRKDRFIENFIP